MAEDFGGLVAGAGVGLGVGAANQIAVDTAFGQKNPGTTNWIVGSLGAGLGLLGHFALPRRSRALRQASDGLVAAGFAVLGQVAAYDADRAMDRVAKSSGSSTSGNAAVPITTSSSSGGTGASTGAATSAGGAASAGSTTSALLALDSSDLSFGAQ